MFRTKLFTPTATQKHGNACSRCILGCRVGQFTVLSQMLVSHLRRQSGDYWLVILCYMLSSALLFLELVPCLLVRSGRWTWHPFCIAVVIDWLIDAFGCTAYGQPWGEKLKCSVRWCWTGNQSYVFQYVTVSMCQWPVTNQWNIGMTLKVEKRHSVVLITTKPESLHVYLCLGRKKKQLLFCSPIYQSILQDVAHMF